jgi:hypothetical protein
MAGSSGDPMNVPARWATTARVLANRNTHNPPARNDLHIGA